MPKKTRIIDQLRARYPGYTWKYKPPNKWTCGEFEAEQVCGIIAGTDDSFYSYVAVYEFRGRYADGYPIWGEIARLDRELIFGRNKA